MAPWPGSLVAVMVPPIDFTELSATESPSPVPAPIGLVVKNGSRCAAGFLGDAGPAVGDLDADRAVLDRLHRDDQLASRRISAGHRLRGVEQ